MAVSLEEGRKLLVKLYFDAIAINPSSHVRIRSFINLLYASGIYIPGRWTEDGPASDITYDDSKEAIALLKMYVSEIGLSSSCVPFFSPDAKTIIDNCLKELENEELSPAQSRKLAEAITTYNLDKTPTSSIWTESNRLSTTSKYLSLAAIVATSAFVVHHLKNKA
jgi:hypothetical protein